MLKVFGSYSPRANSQRQLTLDTFKGVDLTSGAASVDPRRSPDAPNMMPDANGFPVKRPGYWLRQKLEGRINGVYHYKTTRDDHYLIHAGTRLYRNGEVAAEGFADAPSTAVQLKETLWILDGETYRYYRREEDSPEEAPSYSCGPVSEIATVPMVTIGRSPKKEGESTSYQPINLLTGKRTDSFKGDGESTVYHLSCAGVHPLKSEAVQVEIREEEGADWAEAEGGYTVDTEAATVTFESAPAVPVPEGEDNVRITYEVDNAENLASVNKCRFSILYGVAGGMDRVFMSGNPEEPNVDWWSEFNDPAYIGDVYYAALGSESSPIMGYSVLNEKLVTHKQGEENDRNAFVRVGELEEDGDAFFRITNVIQGDGAVSSRCYGTLSSEPVFLSSRGVFALTASDLTGERYHQKRSFYIDGDLKGADLSGACAAVWGKFYVLAANGKLYLLDTDQKSYESKGGSSAYQYECYYWPGIDARAVWVQGDRLWWGDSAGRVFEFFEADGASHHYRDWEEGCPAGQELEQENIELGKGIEAWWSTPLMALGSYGYRKNVLDVWVTAQPYSHSGGDIYYASDRAFEEKVKSWNSVIFYWEDMDFADFSFSSLDRPSAIRCGRKAYGVQLFQVKAANTGRSQPFGVYAIQVDFETGGRTKA